MPITIQEIIASDTISQLVDKTNFNFDQLLLNGGGPGGPAGPQGPTGPSGGRGFKGSTWYEDTSVADPGNTPIAVPPTAAPLSGDYYLQFNGAVWEYDGNTWVITTVNLEGPTGPAGVTGGFTTYFGTSGNVATFENTLMPTPAGWDNTTNTPNGANTSNEGIQTILIGGVGPFNPAVDPSIPLTPAFQLTSAMAGSFASDTISLVVHQKNSQSQGALAFMGGGGTPSDNYEQDQLGFLSHIKLDADDTFTINVPKASTSPASNPDITGFNVITNQRGQNYYAGGQVLLTSGTNAAPTGFPGANGNTEITVGNEGGAAGAGNQLRMITLGTISSTQILSGNTAINSQPGTSSSTGNILIDADKVGIVSNGSEIILESIASSIELYTNQGAGNIDLQTSTGSINSTTSSGNLTMNTSSGNIGVLAAGGTGFISLKAQTGNINIESGSVTATPSIGNIIIHAGYSPTTTGGVSIRSRTYDVTLDATDDADLIIKNNTQNRAQFLGDSIGANYGGRILLGGSPKTSFPSNSWTVYKPLILIDSVEQFGTDTPTNTINVGVTPKINIPQSTTFGVGYNGGGEVIGPYADTLIPGVSPDAPWQREPYGSLHVRTGVRRGTTSSNNNDTTLPGSLWLYNTQPTQSIIDSGTIAAGEWPDANVRIWSTKNPRIQNTAVPGFGKEAAIQGITIGLDSLMESELTSVADYGETYTAVPLKGYEPVSGRTFLYGQSFGQGAQPVGKVLDQNISPISGTDLNAFAGVNVGDRWRGRQSFKVWGDYVGHYYVSDFGGIVSGSNDTTARGEQQVFLSGGQTWSNPYVVNAGSNDATNPNAARFSYKYQWQRLGRVVTGSGMIKMKVIGNAATSPTDVEPNSNQMVLWGGTLPSSPSDNTANNNEITIGPIPWPVQVGNANTTDAGGTTPIGIGVYNPNISGIVTGVIDGMPANRQVTGGLASGFVGGGNTTSMQNTTSSGLSNYMWLKVYPGEDFSGYTLGAVPSYLKFTFTYELRT